MNWTDILVTTVTESLGPLAVVYCLAAIGLNIHFGYTGLLNFGQAGFMAVGSYGLSVMMVTYGFTLWTGIATSLFASVALALVLGVPTLRLRADYLAIATIATAEIVRQVFQSVEYKRIFGGQSGRTGFADAFRQYNPFCDVSVCGSTNYGVGNMTWNGNDLWVMTVGWILVGIGLLVTWLLMRSPWGRVVKSIREDEEAVRSLGKNVYAYKIQALILGGLFGSLAGIMYALAQSASLPSDYATDTTFIAFTLLLIGGAARVFGPVAGTIIFLCLLNGINELFRQATSGNNPLFPRWLMDTNQASLMRFIFLGLALMLLMIFRPQGVFGDKRELQLDAR